MYLLNSASSFLFLWHSTATILESTMCQRTGVFSKDLYLREKTSPKEPLITAMPFTFAGQVNTSPSGRLLQVPGSMFPSATSHFSFGEKSTTNAVPCGLLTVICFAFFTTL